jgi:hypothetical protein
MCVTHQAYALYSDIQLFLCRFWGRESAQASSGGFPAECGDGCGQQRNKSRKRQRAVGLRTGGSSGAGLELATYDERSKEMKQFGGSARASSKGRKYKERVSPNAPSLTCHPSARFNTKSSWLVLLPPKV